MDLWALGLRDVLEVNVFPILSSFPTGMSRDQNYTFFLTAATKLYITLSEQNSML